MSKFECIDHNTQFSSKRYWYATEQYLENGFQMQTTVEIDLNDRVATVEFNCIQSNTGSLVFDFDHSRKLQIEWERALELVGETEEGLWDRCTSGEAGE